MKFLRTALFKGGSKTKVYLTGLFVMAIFFAAVGNVSSTGFKSVEVQFTDASQSGLAIVPASCPSAPYDADAPYGCSPQYPTVPLCPDGVSFAPDYVSIASCTCAQGNAAACPVTPSGCGAGTLNDQCPPSPPTGASASCDTTTHVATFTWAESAGTTYSALRVSDNAFTWTGQCGSDGVPGNWCFNMHPPQTMNGLYGNYSWWVHSCNAYGCSAPAYGNNISCVPVATCPDGSAAPGNNSAACTCAQGNSAACTGATCPDGSAAPGGNPASCSCAQGNSAACSSSGSCLIGYTLQADGSCLFTGCPAGLHASGASCVCNGTNAAPDAAGICASTCPVGFTFDASTGTCVANACHLPNTCSDATHVLNQCTGGTTNCALNGTGWICSSGSCIPPPKPIASISAAPKLVSPGYTTTVSWTSQNTTDCRVSGNNGDGVWTGTNGTHKSSTIQSQTIFTLVCDGYDGSVIKQTAVANIVPVENEPAF